jgi:hypothetical protein
MSDWLERELSRGLAPVAAPHLLKVRLGLAPAKRWEFPREVVAVAAAVLMIIGGGYAASRTAALDLRTEAVVEVVAENAPARARLVRCSGAGTPFQVNATQATVVLAHSGFETPAHTVISTPEAGCHLCHSL